MARLNLLFDLDGTLTDSQPGIVASLRHALEACGVAPPEEARLAATIGEPLQDALGALLGAAQAECLPAAIAAYRERYQAQGQYENRVYDGIEASLAELAARATLYVATSKGTDSAERVLAHFGLRGYFRAVHGSPPGGASLAKGDIIADALATHGLAPAAGVMIGDTRFDILGAREHGLPALGVAWGFGTRAELQAAGALAILEHPAELPAYFPASATRLHSLSARVP
jgi:phosphoglycolate phosphatase